MIARGLLQSSLRRRTPTTLLPTRRWSSTLNESTTSGAPATEEKKKSYKDWIPSRGWQIFWGLTSGLITIAVYDSRRLESIQNDFIERARVQFAQQPSGILERPRKVIVCVSAGDNGKAWFESYVKPVFDAAALDYTVLVPDKAGHLRAKVRQHVWEGKTQKPVLAPPPPPPFSVWSPSTWWPKKESPEEFILRMSEGMVQKYHAEDGIIAIGPEAYQEVLQGIQLGLLSVPTEAPEKRYVLQPQGTDNKALAEYEKEVAEANAEYERGWVYPELELRAENVDGLPGPVPTVGYIPARHFVGWIGFGKRIGNWFRRREVGKEVGEAALMICGNNQRPFDANVDVTVGVKDVRNYEVREKGTEYENGGSEWKVWDGIDNTVASRLRVYA
ncbi:hypothetical protein BCR33DRAFT_850888 [Rhizoclosmatium globosum]|uniref:Mitochondrial import inner membrane translocase subunit TIM54 n=1 Tax=Rhizoclosmatium globosum TaxID=329046 RepID=A0A1Y2C9F6_9FUNG|nr:hypothetical protein BCR33DRAFT_850888 [Rhizoclosmatium globosum]|eukprot:ORY43671.1 hypothetical protein BCR33DRAFT_850888 [Rhizoclosmatium globosum]